MNLIIDVGNTRVKTAVFKDDRLINSYSFDHSEIEIKIEEIKKENQISSVIISKVTSIRGFNAKKMFAESFLIELSNETPVPFKNIYETPKTLGIDRIALAAGAIKKYPNHNVLVIDAGTCITFDFINKERTYVGGAISPGISMRYKALHYYTDKLPELEPAEPKALIGSTTRESINSGIINGVIKEIEGIISEYRMKYSDLTVVLTGGDTNFLAKQLKSSIFANRNFLLEGLNSILIFNNSK
jgi:type III pantothenate kinase